MTALCVVGCDGRTTPDPSSSAVGGGPLIELRIAAASSLKGAVTEFQSTFEAAHPGVKVVATFGASGNFYGQLVNKAPFDVFLSADTGYPHRLAESGLSLPGSERTFARGVLVIWVPAASKLDIEHDGLRALADLSVIHVAIANPKQAPYGRAAEAALKSAGVYEAVKDRIVLGENVEQAAQFAQSGAAEAGLIALSLAGLPAMKSTGRFVEVPGSPHASIEHGLIITAWTPRPAEARQFCDDLTGPAGQAVLAKYGLIPAAGK